MNKAQEITDIAKAVIQTEKESIEALTQRIDQSFIEAHQLLQHCDGRIVVMGIGKSGHIGSKISATFASTGSPAFFIHPAEASHGDLGMITNKDVLLILSNSGETEEVLALLPSIKLIGAPIIAMTGNAKSTLAQHANIHLDVSVEKEACPLKLAPTSSTTAALVMGDALAIALLSSKGFTKDDFAKSHPGGSLGKKLLLNVMSLMHKENAMPVVLESATLKEAMQEMTQKNLGHTLVKSKDNKLVGIYTDGDIRRTIEQDLIVDANNTSISEVMSKNPRSIPPEMLATEALRIMELHKITALPVVNGEQNPIGLLHMHDILRAGFI